MLIIPLDRQNIATKCSCAAWRFVTGVVRCPMTVPKLSRDETAASRESLIEYAGMDAPCMKEHYLRNRTLRMNFAEPIKVDLSDTELAAQSAYEQIIEPMRSERRIAHPRHPDQNTTFARPPGRY